MVSKEYYQEHREEIIKKVKEYNQKNKEKIKEKRKEHEQRPEIKQKIKKRHKKYHKKHYQANREKYLEHVKKYCQNNKEKVERYKKKYRIENKDKLNKYFKKKRMIDENYRIAVILRNRLNQALKIYSQTGKIMTSKKYGIDWNAVIEKLKPFPENLSEYHIDHIRPLCSFDFNDLEEVKKAFAPENHQWLLASENMSKGGRFLGKEA